MVAPDSAEGGAPASGVAAAPVRSGWATAAAEPGSDPRVMAAIFPSATTTGTTSIAEARHVQQSSQERAAAAALWM
ncbi:hypothetical protein ACFWA5_05420 [Streptomyces mirabilis]|uniref:hypothetical protein n=1 Tax=Streptomyces mirabilis TaxID=68239 RepID=UPI003646EE4B